MTSTIVNHVIINRQTKNILKFNIFSIVKSFIPWLLLLAACYAFGSYLVENKHARRFDISDAQGYFFYLPSVFVHGNFKDYRVRTKFYFKSFPGTDNLFTKYTCGVAMLEAPFFLAAYFSRWVQGFEDPGFYESNDYGVAMLMGACFYGILGLFSVYKTLRRHFENRRAAVLTIALLLLGTNLFYYMVREPGMAHVYSFFLASLLVWLTPQIFEKPTWGRFAAAGALLGLLVLIRPTGIVLGFYPLLYGLKSWADAKNRLAFLQKHGLKMGLGALAALAIWLPQFAYWHHVTGDWILYSYRKEGFENWANPPIHKVLFSPLNGWLVYSPAMLFALVGMPFLLKNNRHNGWAVLLIFAVSTYLFASWWCWWFGGALGLRSYVDLMPVLALPVCFVFEKMLAARRWLRVGGLTLVALFCLYNVRLTLIYDGSWSELDMNWERYLPILERVFFL